MVADALECAYESVWLRCHRRGLGGADAVEAWLLDTVASGPSFTEIYDFRLHSSAAQHSAGHPGGTREHLHVYSGRIRVGPVDDPVELGAGDFAFEATSEHLYHRIGKAEPRGLLVITRNDR